MLAHKGIIRDRLIEKLWGGANTKKYIYIRDNRKKKILHSDQDKGKKRQPQKTNPAQPMEKKPCELKNLHSPQ